MTKRKLSISRDDYDGLFGKLKEENSNQIASIFPPVEGAKYVRQEFMFNDE